MAARSLKEPAGPLQARFTEKRLSEGDTLDEAAVAVAYSKGGLMHFLGGSVPTGTSLDRIADYIGIGIDDALALAGGRTADQLANQRLARGRPVQGTEAERLRRERISQGHERRRLRLREQRSDQRRDDSARIRAQMAALRSGGPVTEAALRSKASSLGISFEQALESARVRPVGTARPSICGICASPIGQCRHGGRWKTCAGCHWWFWDTRMRPGLDRFHHRDCYWAHLRRSGTRPTGQLAERVQDRRRELALTVVATAKELGMGSTKFMRWLKGEARPTADQVGAIVRLLADPSLTLPDALALAGELASRPAASSATMRDYQARLRAAKNLQQNAPDLLSDDQRRLLEAERARREKMSKASNGRPPSDEARRRRREVGWDSALAAMRSDPKTKPAQMLTARMNQHRRRYLRSPSERTVRRWLPDASRQSGIPEQELWSYWAPFAVGSRRMT